MEHIDCVYYINLDHREDRNALFLEEMRAYQIPESKIHRVSGVYEKGFGALGCAKSHVYALEHFIHSSFETCMIFEDDFQFVMDKIYFHTMVNEVFEQSVPYDIILLAGNIFETKQSPYPFLKRVLDAQTTSGYMVSKSFAKILVEVFKESIHLLNKYSTVYGLKVKSLSIDQHWKHIQPYYNWYVFFPKAGIQRESYSDIEEAVTNYKV